ncbi:MAG: alpha-amylase family glycosyl hydrolase [Rhodospirillales bacterium]
MALIPVHFEYRTGLRRPFIQSARLTGNWTANGLTADAWTTTPMQAFTADDGCPAFRATVQLDDSQIGRVFRWGVRIDTAPAPDRWGIPTEIGDPASRERYRSFTLERADQTERYDLTHCRLMGANKLTVQGRSEPAVRFAVWAPNARAVELVRGDRASGYIWNDGRGTVVTIPMRRRADGVWETEVATAADLASFAAFDHTPYMYRITRDDGSIAYRSDLFSRCQIGSGRKNPDAPRPGDPPWNGTREDLDGVKSCSVVVDPERVARQFREVDANGRVVWPETEWQTEDEFWANEFDPARPLPERLSDLVIYELHVDGLGVGVHDRGMLEDAIDLLDYLADLGVNCVELMPFSEYEGWANWGYATSHYLSMEYAGGGRDQFKHFVRACHRRGIAVLLDVVYNHYTHDGERAQWAYDSPAPERNIWYWYEGRPGDYPAYEDAARRNPQQIPAGHGGYVDNMSTGYAPRYSEEMVRKLFVSSAAQLVAEFHVDGFRVDQTTSIHSYAVLHADGRPADNARVFGAKFLREWTRTLQLISPRVFLIAEDHSGWSVVTEPNDDAGLGFQAVWYADYYHHLIGDAQNDPRRARLLKFAGYGDDRALNMTWFAGELAGSGSRRIIYHESHDEAGNSYYEEGGQRVYSARTISVAVNNASLVGQTRRYAEARTRVVAGITLLAAAVPMFFMGEEVGASRPYRYDDFLANREDYPALRRGAGAQLFRFYQDVIRLRLGRPALRSPNIEILHVHDGNRLIAFRRWDRTGEFIVVASLSNWAFSSGYQIRDSRIIDGDWREVLNSDAAAYGGGGQIAEETVVSSGGSISPHIAANSIIVLQRQ